jgi:hypothetical protein
MTMRRSIELMVGGAVVASVAATAVTTSKQAAGSDLAITHAAVLDVRSGTVLRDRTVVVANGIITGVLGAGQSAPRAARVIDAHGRLLTPSFIDAHLHLCSIYPPPCTDPRAGRLRLSMTPDSIASYRRTLSALYLPYGVTAVRDVGSEERVMPLLLAWMKRSPDAPDFYPVGAQLISPDPNHTPAPWQVEVADSAAAAAKVHEYHALGIRNIKLYWRLREPAFQGALSAAQQLGMNVTGHVDFGIVPVDRALALGLRNFEHMTAWAFLVLSQHDIDSVYRDVGRRIGIGRANPRYPGFYFMAVPEEWNRIGGHNPRLLALVDEFRTANAFVTPTLHVFAERLGLTYFTLPARTLPESTSSWSSSDRARAVAGYRVMASYVKRLHDAGVRLNVGTDAPEPGKAVLSEMLLLHDSGIPMPGVFRIATIESAQGIGHGAEYGSIEAGKRADLILFEGDPLRHPLDLLETKTVIKDGVVFVHQP